MDNIRERGKFYCAQWKILQELCIFCFLH